MFSFEGGGVAVPCPLAGEGQLGLRPEHIQFNANAPWRGEVLLVEPTGADTFVVVKTATGAITTRTAPHTAVKVGDTVGLQFAPEHAHWFDRQTGARVATEKRS